MRGTAESVPGRFPIFPLEGALLLPGGNLPLNIFEPRYLAMVRDAMRTDRVIGMIQPTEPEVQGRRRAIYRTGCLGGITSFAETQDGRFLITLTGLCRFDVAEELAVTTPYRQVIGDFERWRGDLAPSEPPETLRPRLLAATEVYFSRRGIETDWDAVRKAPLTALVTSLAMLCPFAPGEKQAILEAADLAAQGELLVALMEMDARAARAGATPVRH
ncbi:MAG: LON peptidase substrate-binding domain-containing protein [Geminicoccaceae bacterium]|nr:LON peptidase substrate-binding domain-containing protein [Geminicoccaceae bacterium]